MVERQGRLMPLEDAIRLDIETQKQLATSGKGALAIKNLRGMLVSYANNKQIPEIHFGLAEVYVITNHQIEAEAEYRQIIEKYPTHAYAETAKGLYGILLFKRGQIAEAKSV